MLILNRRGITAINPPEELSSRGMIGGGKTAAVTTGFLFLAYQQSIVLAACETGPQPTILAARSLRRRTAFAFWRIKCHIPFPIPREPDLRSLQGDYRVPRISRTLAAQTIAAAKWRDSTCGRAAANWHYRCTRRSCSSSKSASLVRPGLPRLRGVSDQRDPSPK